MNFEQLSWGAVCFYYRSAGDGRYCRTFEDTSFIETLRKDPAAVNIEDFEKKIILNHIKIENYDLLVGHRLSERVLSCLVELQPITDKLSKYKLLSCDLEDSELVDAIKEVYAKLYSVRGLWLTGVSKVAHLLNDDLFVLLNLDISNHFGLLENETSLLQWLRVTQSNAVEVTEDYQKQGNTGDPASFLSEKIGYSKNGYTKSLIKFIDEYFWLKLGDNLPIPPKWFPGK